MDIITNKSAVAPQVPKYETRQAEPVILTRSVASVDTPMNQSPSRSENVAQSDKQAVESAVASMQESTQAMQRNLAFSIDDSTGRMVVKVTDSASGEVIRQMPTEEALRLAESLDEMRSLLFKAQA